MYLEGGRAYQSMSIRVEQLEQWEQEIELWSAEGRQSLEDSKDLILLQHRTIQL
jgi:hypothetical protein